MEIEKMIQSVKNEGYQPISKGELMEILQKRGKDVIPYISFEYRFNPLKETKNRQKVFAKASSIVNMVNNLEDSYSFFKGEIGLVATRFAQIDFIIYYMYQAQKSR